MKKHTIFAIVMISLCLVACNSKKDNNKDYNDSILKKEAHDREVKRHQEEYNVLSQIGLDRWGSFEKYYDFIEVDPNERRLDKELEQEGLYLYELGWIYNSQFGELSINTQVNVLYIKWLYLHFRAAGVVEESFNEFMNRLWDEKDFLFFYKTSCDLGLVDSWSEFIALMFESDCDYCKEENWDEWLDEMKEELNSEYERDYDELDDFDRYHI